MTSLDTEHDYIPGENRKPAEPTIAPAPFDAPLVKATVGAMAAVATMQHLLSLLQDNPRDFATLRPLYADAEAKLQASFFYFEGYREILECKGQA